MVPQTIHPTDVTLCPVLVVVLTSTFWRNSWKYQARAYRHAFWDGGVILANLLALASADGCAEAGTFTSDERPAS